MKTRSKVIGCILFILMIISIALVLRSVHSIQISRQLRDNNLDYVINFRGREFHVKTCKIDKTCLPDSKIINQYKLLLEDNFSETPAPMTFAGRIIKNIVRVGYEYRQPRFCADPETEKICANFFAQYASAKGILSNPVVFGSYRTNLPNTQSSINSYITDYNELISTLRNGESIVVHAKSLEPLKMTNEERMLFVNEVEISLTKAINDARNQH